MTQQTQAHHGENGQSVPPAAAHQADPICPYCGGGVPAGAGRIGDVGTRCPTCKGLLDDLSIHATRGHMGEWFVRDENAPFRPGCSLSTLRAMIERGRIDANSVVRGPDTEQFWYRAGHVPRTARLMGMCHECQHGVTPDAGECASCGTHLMSLGDANAETAHAHAAAPVPAVNPFSTAPAQSASAAIAESAVKRQMQREVRIWARRAGVSIGIAGFLFLIVIALATKDMWWSRVRGGEAQAPAATAPATAPATTPSPAPVAAPVAAPVVAPVESEPAPVVTPPKPEPPAAPARASRDPIWEQVAPLITADTKESLLQAVALLQQLEDKLGADRAEEAAQARATREWIERRMLTKDLSELP